MVDKNDATVTVALPVYNEEKYLEETLNSLIPNYPYIDEILISDNCSTDRTGEICIAFKDKYEKVKYIRQNTAITPRENFLFLLKQAKMKYFMWLGGHDWISENYIREGIHALENEEAAITVLPMIYGFSFHHMYRNIAVDASKSILSSRNMEKRIRYVIDQPSACLIVNQLWNKKYLLETVSYWKKEYISFDLILPMFVALKGRAISVIDSSYYFRDTHFEKLGHEESFKERTERYKNTHHVEVPFDNQYGYVYRLYQHLCSTIIPEKYSPKMKMKIIQAGHKFYNSDSSYDEWKMRNNPNAFEQYLIEGEKHIYLFGTGMESRLLHRIIKYIDIYGYIDNDPRKWGITIENIPVISPLKLPSPKENVFIIIATTKSQEEISDQLIDMGYDYWEQFVYWREIQDWVNRINCQI